MIKQAISFVGGNAAGAHIFARATAKYVFMCAFDDRFVVTS